ncbi:MAG: hypothetical protein N4A63_10615 [Vallitalea sp.]|jgi:hypothetical protein|nr:hypothetical protein [Vallitalea sp.]
MNNRTTRNTNRRKYNKRNKRYQEEPTTSGFTIKIFISFVILLSILYLKKYEVKIGNFGVDKIYEVLYYNEDFNELSNKAFKIGNDTANFLHIKSADN